MMTHPLLGLSVTLFLLVPTISIATQIETFDLVSQSKGAPQGRVAFHQTPEGIRIQGEVNQDSQLRFAKTPSEMPQGDHVELWVNLVSKPDFPSIGWRDQFQETQVDSAKKCLELDKDWNQQQIRECQSWYGETEKYRVNLAKLFIRQWQMAPSVTVETYAKPALEKIKKSLLLGKLAQNMNYVIGMLTRLFSSGEPTFQVSVNQKKGPGYSFDILLPWNALPPAASLDLGNLRVRVDVYRGGSGPTKYGPHSSTYAQAQYGNVETMNSLKLPEPRQYQLTPCRVAEKQFRSNSKSIYYLPSQELNLKEFFMLLNETHGYQYRPEYPSPEVSWTRLHWNQLGPEEYVCGPKLSYTDGKKFAHSTEDLARPGMAFDSKTPWTTLSQKLPSGEILIRSGPGNQSSFTGAGQCGGCPRYTFQMFMLNQKGEFQSLINLREVVDCQPITNDMAIELSPDWKKLTLFRRFVQGQGESGPWMKQCFELRGSEYFKCGGTEPAPKDLRLPKEAMQPSETSPKVSACSSWN